LHRDLKPENIMLMQSGGAKLVDFDVAKVQDSGCDARTETITVVGTMHYVSPEQLMGRASLRSDLFALGVVCYEMLTGRPPFQPATPFHLYELQKSAESRRRPRFARAFPRAPIGQSCARSLFVPRIVRLPPGSSQRSSKRRRRRGSAGWEEGFFHGPRLRYSC
jgi:serine/threonine protein kinase